MDRNTILAFALSMIVFVAYVMYQEEQRVDQALEGAPIELAETDEAPSPRGAAPSSAAIDRDPVEEPPSVPRGSSSAASSPSPSPARPGRTIPSQSLTLRNEDVVATISNGPALIESWKLLHYMERLPDGDIPIELIDPQQPVVTTLIRGVPGERFSDARFEVVSHDARTVVQRAENAAGVLTRTFRLDEAGYGFDLELGFESRRTDPVDAYFEILWPSVANDRADFRELSLLAYGESEGVTRELVQGVGQPGFFGIGGSADGIERVDGRAQWAGFDVPYFTGLVIDPQGRERLGVEFEALVPKESAFARVTLPSVAIGPGGTVTESVRGFVGPKAPDALEAGGAGLQHTVNRGWSWLEPLTRFFEIALDWLYALIPNYGVAIIVLTILVRIFTAPLMVRQMKSSERMRAVQPRVQALQEKYKDDRQKQSEEMMKLWREEGVNPLGGCLPLLIQFPVLIGLFYALRSSIGLRHAPFVLWINDLSQPATLFTVPGIDFPVRLLPLIMGGSMFVQQKMMPSTGMDPAQAKMMLVMMPAMMLLVSYTFPSGLVLYWTVSNLLGIAHQYWVRSKMQPQS